MTTLKWLLIVAVAGYAGIVGFMYMFQRALVFFPDRTRTPPSAAGLPQVEELRLTSSDGETLVAWTAPPRDGKPVLIYFHGNAGALNLRADRFRWLTGDGFGLVALSYRGYGGSSGSPSEEGFLRDAEAAFAFAKERYPNAPLVPFGESLGTAMAVAVAAGHDVAGLILDAPFTSAVDVGAAVYPFAPVRWLMKDTFHSDRRIGRVRAPILVLHGESDTIVPIGFGERLFALATAPKQFVRFPNGGHVNLDDHGAKDVIRAFLARIVGASAAAQ
jgi:fermentation-respiration switch protein FrsA (DUF1100 family)